MTRGLPFLFLAAMVAGCGSSGSSGDKAAVKSAVVAYSKAYLGGQVDQAWSLLSSRCQQSLGRSAFSRVVSAAGDRYGSMSPTSVSVDSLGSGRASVTYSFAASALNQSGQPWVLESGGWRYDAC